MENEFITELFKEHQTTSKCPAPSVVADWLDKLLGALFPGICDLNFETEKELAVFIEQLKNELHAILKCNENDHNIEIAKAVDAFFAEVPKIKALLVKDVEALYLGDPAAKSTVEVTRSYPGFYATAAHRIAHELYLLKVCLIPRMISEHAHKETGVDIHPGATIGEHFCIDHGTGIVIGETTHIGNNVKIYQGVTLGGLSVDKSLAETKRHPTIEDGVVIYAGATILGGTTTVGANSVVGGNVFLTKSVAPGSKVYYKARMSDSNGNEDTITFKS